MRKVVEMGVEAGWSGLSFYSGSEAPWKGIYGFHSASFLRVEIAPRGIYELFSFPELAAFSKIKEAPIGFFLHLLKLKC
jgi:hypothetical protein